MQIHNIYTHIHISIDCARNVRNFAPLTTEKKSYFCSFFLFFWVPFYTLLIFIFFLLSQKNFLTLFSYGISRVSTNKSSPITDFLFLNNTHPIIQVKLTQLTYINKYNLFSKKKEDHEIYIYLEIEDLGYNFFISSEENIF